MTLSVAGTIDRMTLDLNGDSDYLDPNEMDDSRDVNKANELLTRDVDASGKVDATDTSQIQSWIDAGTYDVRGDVDLDVDSTDKTTVQNYTATKSSRGTLSHAEHGNRKGYAGYEFDDTITHESYHVRHRVLNSVLGQWTSRLSLMHTRNTYHFQADLIVSAQSAQVGGTGLPGGVGGTGWNPPPCANQVGLGGTLGRPRRTGAASCCLGFKTRALGDCRYCGCNGWSTYQKIESDCGSSVLPPCSATPPAVYQSCCIFGACLGTPGISLQNQTCQNACNQCCGSHYTGQDYTDCIIRWCTSAAAGYDFYEIPIIG